MRFPQEDERITPHLLLGVMRAKKCLGPEDGGGVPWAASVPPYAQPAELRPAGAASALQRLQRKLTQ